MRSTLILLLAIAASAATTPAAMGAAPFYGVDRDSVEVPAGVMPWDPVFSPDGKHILFIDDNNGGEWIADADGTDARCLTCSMQDAPNQVYGGFVYGFPDNKRMFFSNELGDLAYVLECAPSLYECDAHKWLPIDLSGDAATGVPNFGRRTYHLAPDGQHLGYTITRPDGLVMLVAKLERRDSDYGLVDYHVVNPSGPKSPLDTDPTGWNNGGSLDELKAFADGGRSIIALTEPSSVPEQVKIDLATGKVTRLTGYPDWTEDGSFSPDGASLLSASWRTQNRLTALAQVPIPSFIALPADAIIGIYYVSSRPGFACDIVPWLLPAEGDQGGALVGQPLNPYGGGTTIPANNLAGQQVWSPDSTRVLLQGRSLLDPPSGANDYLDQKGPAPSRLVIAHILRKPTRPQPTVETKVGDWAPTPQSYQSSFDMPGTHVVEGRKGGTATFTINGNIVAGDFTAVYSDYTDDGKHFLNGTQTVNGSVVATTHITDDLTVTDVAGKQVGRLQADLTFSQVQPAPTPASGQPGVSKSGTVTSTWKGRTVSGIPDVAPCPKSMPRRPRLAVSAKVRRRGRARLVTATVTAGIAGDRRPVQGATVRVAGRHGVTDRRGRVRVRVPRARARRQTMRATAGDTFAPARVSIRL